MVPHLLMNCGHLRHAKPPWPLPIFGLHVWPWAGKNTWRRAWQPTPGFLPGESRGQRSLAGYSPSGHRELKRTQPSTAQLYSHPPCGPQSSLSFPKQLLGVHPSMYLPMCSPPRVVFFYKSPVTTVPWLGPTQMQYFHWDAQCKMHHLVLSSQHHWLCILCSLRSPVHHDKLAPRHVLFPTQMGSPCPTHLSSFLKVCSRPCHMAETQRMFVQISVSSVNLVPLEHLQPCPVRSSTGTIFNPHTSRKVSAWWLRQRQVK